MESYYKLLPLVLTDDAIRHDFSYHERTSNFLCSTKLHVNPHLILATQTPQLGKADTAKHKADYDGSLQFRPGSR